MTTPEPSAPEPSEREAHIDGSDRFKVVRGPYWWAVRIGDGQQTVGKFHTEKSAQELAFQLLRAFRDGHFAALKPSPSPVVAVEQPIAWWSGRDYDDDVPGLSGLGSFVEREDTWHDIPVYAGWNNEGTPSRLNPKRPEEGKS